MVSDDDMFDFDFAVILHSHSQRLIGISEWLEPVLEYLGKDPFIGHGDISHLEVEQALLKPITKLHNSLEKIFNTIGGDLSQRNIPEEFMANLEDIKHTLSKYLDAPWGKKYRPAYIYAQLTGILELCERNKQIKVAKQLKKTLIFDTKEVQRILCLYDMKNAIIRINEMEYQTRELREFYSDSIHPQIHKDIILLSDIVRSAMREQNVYAKAKRIELRFDDNSSNPKIIADRRIISRAVSSVINNAIKYNYTLRSGKVWVQIILSDHEDNIKLSVENWGAPITKDELESGIIFKPGIRGAYAKAKKGESGNGIGLTDVKRTVEAFNGSIEIFCRPAKNQVNGINYEKPFITTIHIFFPKMQESS
ncbi:sensor histidine kinase [Desulfocicer niacini]